MKIDPSKFRKIVKLQAQTSLQGDGITNTVIFTDISQLWAEVAEYSPVSSFFSAASAGMSNGVAPTHKISLRFSNSLFAYYQDAAKNGYKLYIDYLGRKLQVLSAQESDDMSHRLLHFFALDTTLHQ